MIWKPIATANKPVEYQDQEKSWILGIDSVTGEQRVCRWSTEYPYSEGVWLFACAPTDYIDDIQSFNPTHWMELPEPPK